ncbi:UvrABC system protein C [Escherichia coli]|uniref:UvrABC system protein C n=1 Tax=Escherichia coli TaxID=562 RepID=A0A377B9E2_ECOLX|nr:UvrABC system protein C [Escherichia coli]
MVETFVGQFYLQGSQMRTLPGEILLDFNLSDKTLLADSFQNWRDARLMFKPNLAAIGRVI